MTKKEAFLLAMLESPTVTKAIEKSGVGKTTAYRYMKDEGFQNELLKRKTQAMDEAVTFLQCNLSRCAEVLIDIVNNKKVSPQIRINAINSVFTNTKAMNESVDVFLRIVELERRTKRNGNGGDHYEPKIT